MGDPSSEYSEQNQGRDVEDFYSATSMPNSSHGISEPENDGEEPVDFTTEGNTSSLPQVTALSLTSSSTGTLPLVEGGLNMFEHIRVAVGVAVSVAIGVAALIVLVLKIAARVGKKKSKDKKESETSIGTEEEELV